VAGIKGKDSSDEARCRLELTPLQNRRKDYDLVSWCKSWPKRNIILHSQNRMNTSWTSLLHQLPQGPS